MSKQLAVIALAMLVLVGAMGLKTAVAGKDGGAVVEEWWSSNSAGALEVTYFRSAA